MNNMSALGQLVVSHEIGNNLQILMLHFTISYGNFCVHTGFVGSAFDLLIIC